MKKLILIVSFSATFGACHQGVHDSEKTFSEKQPLVDTITAYNKHSKLKGASQENTTAINDTVYKVGSFLISAYKGMKLDVISKKNPPETRASKGDTLYDDKDTLILGDFDDMSKHCATGSICCGDSLGMEGVFKKRKLKSKFFSFKIDSIYKGKLASPDFRTDDVTGYYRTIIRQNGYVNPEWARKGNIVNFAGHYTIIEWSKQGTTQVIAIVDRMNGRVYHKFPFGVFDWYFGGTEYYKNSRMLILHPDLLGIYPGYCLLRDGTNDFSDAQPEVYIWNDSAFKRIE